MNKFSLFIIIAIIQCFNVSSLGYDPDFRYINSNNVNVRKGPDIKYDSIGFLKIGTLIRVIKINEKLSDINGIKDYWLFCEYEGGEGWIFGKFISKGRFDSNKFINSILKPINIPSQYSKVIGIWSSCTEEEANSGGMGCYGVNLTETYIGYLFPGTGATYQILDIKLNNDYTFTLSLKLVLYLNIFNNNFEDHILGLKGNKELYKINILLGKNNNSILINGYKYYKHRR